MRYTEKLIDRRWKIIESIDRGKDESKKCAAEAALAVAQNWNPALTYEYQKESMLRIADEIYNKIQTTSLLVRAIPGLILPTDSSRQASNQQDQVKPIEQLSKTTPLKRYSASYTYSSYNAPAAMKHFSEMYEVCHSCNQSLFSTEDVFQDYCASYANIGSPTTGNCAYHITLPEAVEVDLGSNSTSTGKSMKYTTRRVPADPSLKIECENDKIKVTARSDDIAYATPATCNVDIILTIPTNNAAMNPDNADGAPYVSSANSATDDAKKTPIYQISRAYKTFLKNFFYTRGVNVGVIPYSGKISLPKCRAGWVQEPSKFNPAKFLDYSYDPYVAGCMLYGASGKKGENLDKSGDYAGANEAFGLLCRGPTEDYKGNIVTIGDLLSSSNPSSYKFRKMQYNGCYAPYANLLSMQCEKFNHNDLMNPYFVVEMTSNVKFVYDLMEAFYPYYDEYNDSNFSFLAITWANNLLQNWSDSAGFDAVDSSKSTTDARLSCPAKTKAGRKKVLILVVNKPEQFEPNELTYLGFNNDYAEIPAVDGDTISFKTDFSDSSRKFADGTAYDGTIMGQKGILKFQASSGRSIPGYGYYCDSGTIKLKFPKKWLLRLKVVGSAGEGTIKFMDIISNDKTTTTDLYKLSGTQEFNVLPEQIRGSDGENYCVTVALNGVMLISAGITNRPYKMSGDEEQKRVSYKTLSTPANTTFLDTQNSGKTIDYKNTHNDAVVYGGNNSGNLANTGIKFGEMWWSEDLEVGDWWWKLNGWEKVKERSGSSYSFKEVEFINGAFIVREYYSSTLEDSYYSVDGKNWTQLNSVVYGNGVFVGIDKFYIYRSVDGTTWEKVKERSGSSYSFKEVEFINGAFIVREYYSSTLEDSYYSVDGKNWTQLNSVVYGNGVFVGIDKFYIYRNALTGWHLYSNSGASSTNHNFFLKYPGDMFFLTDAELYEIDSGKICYNLNNGAYRSYLGGGLNRFTADSGLMDREKGKFSWSIDGLGDDILPVVAAGVTLPANFALFCGNGEDGNEKGTYQWQSDGSGNLVKDPNEALKQVSKDACAKLKKDFGNDLEVYVINFRGQGDVDECASGSDHVYSAEDQKKLEEVLVNIEKKIKEGAKYEKAKVVD